VVVGSIPAWPVDTTSPFPFGQFYEAALSLSDLKEFAVAGKGDKSKRENGIQRFFRETMGELRRVSWPTWLEARNLTVVVIIVLVIMALFLWGIDSAGTKLLTIIIGA
jgi:preprotein translocase subunit SecE